MVEEAQPDLDSQAAAPTAEPTSTADVAPPNAQSTAVEFPEGPNSVVQTLVAEAGTLPGMNIYRFPFSVKHAAYDEGTGHMMALKPEGHKALILKIDERVELVSEIETVRKPYHVIAKKYQGKSLFIVSGEDTNQIKIHDARDGKLVGTVVAPGPIVYRMQTSRNENDPFVYYTCRLEKDGPEQIRRFHIGELRDDGRIKLIGSSYVISAYGDLLYGARNPTNSRSADFDAWRILEGPRSTASKSSGMAPIELDLLDYGDNARIDGLSVDPHQCYGKCLNLSFAHLEIVQAANHLNTNFFFPGKPWVFAFEYVYGPGLIKNDSLDVSSTNAFGSLVKVPLPRGFLSELPNDDHSTYYTFLQRDPTYRFRFFADAQRERIVMSAEDRLITLPLSALDLPEQRTLAFDLHVPQVVLPGSSVSVPMQVYDDHQSKTKLVTHPPGMELTEDLLTWQPREEHVGRHEVVIERSHGDALLVKKFAIDVRRESIETPFAAHNVSLSNDGSMAVVWGNVPDDKGRNRNELLTELAVVDLAKREVTAQRTIEQGIQAAAIEGENVYVITRSKSSNGEAAPLELLQLLPKDLTLVSSTDARSNGSSNIPLTVVGGRYLLAGNSRFELPGFQELPVPVANQGQSGSHEDGLTDRGWVWDGVLWDEEFRKPQLLLGPPSFAQLGATPGVQYHESRKLFTWGRQVSNQSVNTFLNRQILSGRDQSVLAVSNNAPVAFCLLGQTSRDGNSESTITVHRLKDGKQIGAYVLARSSLQNTTAVAMQLAGDKGLACANGKLYDFSAKALIPKPQAAPFRIAPLQSELLLNPTRAVAVEYKILDGTPPFDATFTIGGERINLPPGGKVIAKFGGRELYENVLRSVGNSTWPRFDEKTASDPEQQMLAYVDAVTPQFKQIVGRNPRGVPIAINAHVEVKDKELLSAELQHVFLLELSTVDVLKKIGGDPRTSLARSSTRDNPREDAPVDKAKQRELDLALALDYSNSFRRNHRHKELDPSEYEAAWAKAAQPLQELLAAEIADFRKSSLTRVRTWTDRKGRTTEASLKSAFADDVVLSLKRGGDVTVPLERFSDADQKFLQEKGEDPSGVSLAAIRMRILLRAIHKHVGRTGAFPPAYLVDEQGKPQLSWRVLLLEDLGAGEILSLFRLNEPWDSKHNRRLIKMMPAVFGDSSSEGAQGASDLLALTCDSSLFAKERPMAANQVKEPLDSVVLITKADAKHGVAWTQPKDLLVRVTSSPARKLTLFGDRHLVGLANGAVRTVPSDASSNEWYEAIDASDGKTPTIQFGSVFDR